MGQHRRLVTAAVAACIVTLAGTAARADEPCRRPDLVDALFSGLGLATEAAFTDDGSADDRPPQRDNWNAFTPAARASREEKGRIITTWGVRAPRAGLFYDTTHNFEGDPFRVTVDYSTGRWNSRWAHIDVRYTGDNDVNTRHVRWVAQIPNTVKPIRPRITVRQNVAKGKNDTGVTTFLIDVHGDGSHVIEINHYTVTNNRWDPPVRLHSWDWETNRHRGGLWSARTVEVRDPDAIPVRGARRR